MKLYSALLFALLYSSAGFCQKPNIIFILADDLGYGNINSNKIHTPNIAQLSARGTTYTHFYAGNTVCAPSRCALMTAKHMGHAYVRGNTRLPLRPQDSTLAQLLQANGYTTGMFGKWGLGEEGTTGSPEIKGFDEFFGYLNQRHAHDYYADSLYEVKKGKISKVAHDTTIYTHDAIMEHALSFIRDNKDNPFFLYLPVTLPHAELAPPAKDLARHLNKYGKETPYLKGGGSYRSQPNPHAAFAAMVEKLDKSVGDVVALINELHLEGDTYIFFTSDNGPHKEGGADPVYFNSAGSLRGIKRDLYEGGLRVPLIVKAPGKVPAARKSDQSWAFWDILPTITDITHSRTLPGIDGISFKESLSGKPQVKQHDYLYWQFNEGYIQEAVIKGSWKLLRFKYKGKPEKFELYNLDKDAGERNDLAAANPDKVRMLSAIMKQAKTAPENPEFDWSATEQ